MEQYRGKRESTEINEDVKHDPEINKRNSNGDIAQNNGPDTASIVDSATATSARTYIGFSECGKAEEQYLPHSKVYEPQKEPNDSPTQPREDGFILQHKKKLKKRSSFEPEENRRAEKKMKCKGLLDEYLTSLPELLTSSFMKIEGMIQPSKEGPKADPKENHS